MVLDGYTITHNGYNNIDQIQQLIYILRVLISKGFVITGQIIIVYSDFHGVLDILYVANGQLCVSSLSDNQVRVTKYSL